MGATTSDPLQVSDASMSAPRVALVSRDPDIRFQLAAAFDEAPADWVVGLFDSLPEAADAIVVGGDVDAEGIRFDGDARATLGRVRRALRASTAGKSFVVTAASGGSGVTTVALHLAAALGRNGTVCFVELDPNEGARYRLDVPDPKEEEVTIGSAKDDLLRAALPVSGGFRVLLRSSVASSDRPIERCRHAFSKSVIDAGTASLDTDLLTSSTANVLVVPPTVPGARRARSLLGRHPDVRWAIVTNRVGPGSEATHATIESILGRRVAVQLPCAPRLRDAEDEADLLSSPWCAWTRRLDRLASRLATL